MSGELRRAGELLEESRRAERRGRDDVALALALQALLQIHRSAPNGDPQIAASHERATLHAKAALVRIGQRQDWNWLDANGREIGLSDGTPLLVVHDTAAQARLTPDPREWTRIEPAVSIVARELPRRAVTEGTGVPLVFSRDVDGDVPPLTQLASLPPLAPLAPLVPLVSLEREVEVIPTTLLAAFDESDPDRPRLLLRWQATLESVEWNLNGSAAPTPVAADFSAPLEVFGAAGGFRAPALRGLLVPDRFANDIQLFRMTPGDPDRVPVVLVHGLASQPLTWRRVVNELMLDPVIRERCEFYYFAYPTSQPMPYVAYQLRNSLATLKEEGLADDGELLLIGHSLGGLVSKAQVVDPGSRLWDVFFKIPADEAAEFGPATERIRTWLDFNPSPVVGRVVFIATPHGGSEVADSWVGQIGRRIARVPRDAVNLAGNVLALDVAEMTDAGRRVATHFPTTVQGLSPRSPFLQAFRPLPVVDGVGTHVIYGNRNGDRSNGPCTDGVVTCESARLPGMDSEVMVVSGHSAHESQAAMVELRRIIRLHLDQLDRR